MEKSIRDQEDELFDRWSAGRSSFSRDGLADECAYLGSRKKILFLLKEVNDRDRSNFDLRTFLREGGRPKTWDMVTRWVKALRWLEAGGSPDLNWTDYETVTEADRVQHLGTVGAVNMKKSAGNHTTDPGALRSEATADASLLDQQLRLYAPNLFVCCGGEVTRLAARIPLLAKGEWQVTRRGVRFWEPFQECVVIDYCHPEVRIGKNLHMAFYPLVDAVAEIWSRPGGGG